MSKRGLALIVIAACAVAALVYSQYRRVPLQVSGFVESYEIRIGSRIGGRVQRVLIEEGASVQKGDLLVALEPFDLNERRAQAQSELAARTADYQRLAKGYRTEEVAQAKATYDQLAAQLAELEHGPRQPEIAAAEAQVRLADAQLMLAQQQMDRVERTFARNAATQDDMDQATTSLRVARATLESRQNDLALLKQGTRPEQIDQAKAKLEEVRQVWLMRQNGYRPEEIAEAKAAAEAAEAALKAIEQQLAELNVTAPLDAVVEAVDLRPGDMIAPNAPVLSLLDTSRLWIRAYVPENHMGVKIDQPVWVSVDSFPNERFRGHITYISRQAEFTPNNVQTPDERSKQVFRIRVTLDEGLDRLRSGSSADVWFDDPPMK